MHHRTLTFCSLLALTFGGCAATGDAGMLTTAAADGPPKVASNGYVLSGAEQKLNCKQLTGRMQVRILAIREFSEREATSGSSALSHNVQKAAASTIGGSTKGTDPYGTHEEDLRMLTAYNELLAGQGCKTYDLAKELAPGNHSTYPSVVKGAKKAKAKKQD